MVDAGLIIFLIFFGISIYVVAKSISRQSKRKQQIKRKYKPYMSQQTPLGKNSYPPYNRGPYQTPSPSNQVHSNNNQSRYSQGGQQGQYSTARSPPQNFQQNNSSSMQFNPTNADDYYRAGMYDKAKDEYLKTGRIFGAAKSVAAKGIDHTGEALEIISRYAPEREEEMVRNLSRYFFDSGEVEISAKVLYDYGLKEESNAVLATIGKDTSEFESLEQPVEVDTFAVSADPLSYSTSADLASEGGVEGSYSSLNTSLDDKGSSGLISEREQAIFKELDSISSESPTVTVDPFASTEVKEVIAESTTSRNERSQFKKQPLKIATSDLDERCTVCLGTIKAGESFVRCPHCGKPAHYSHLIEWLKVKSQCPNCRKELSIRMFQIS